MTNPFMLGFCALVLSALLWPQLLPWYLIPVTVLGGVGLLRQKPLLAGALLGATWISLYVQYVIQPEHHWGNEPVSVEAEIISPASGRSDWQHIDIRIVKPQLILPPGVRVSQKVRLSWKEAPLVQAGERWRLLLRFKAIDSVLNQGGFNGQRQLLAKHIGARATVLRAERLAPSTAFRTVLVNRLDTGLASLSHRDLLQALLSGDRNEFAPELWQALRISATGHLVTISGLHLSVVAAWIYGLVFFLLQRFFPTPTRRNLLLAMVFAALAVIGYGWLAGMGLATQRALVMLLLLMLLSLMKRFASPWERLLWALFFVLLWDPLAILGGGLWLSFSAIAIILLTVENAVASEHSGIRMRLKQFLRLQLALSLGLALVQGLLFGGLGLHGVWMNLLMVPWFSLVVIPLTMAGLMGALILMPLDLPIDLLFQPANAALWPFVRLLDTVQTLPLAWWPLADAQGAALLFVPLAWMLWRLNSHWSRWLAAVFVLPLLLEGLVSTRSADSWRAHVLDVGQGLAVVVEQQHGALLYDTGAAFGADFSYAERVIVPFLRSRGISTLDYLIVSHEDNDHAGGLEVIKRNVAVDRLISDGPWPDAEPCRPGTRKWHALSLSFLWPASQPAGRVGNNGSCVLHIGGGGQSLLLPGDIEREAELAMMADLPSATLLVAPHHGSRTSSGKEFIARVQPEKTVFAAGAGNRYGFPKADIVERYRASGSAVYVTGDSGQLSFEFDGSQVRVRGYRSELAPFWYNRRFGVGDSSNPE
ncbi:DNA internalization-related competence protein ComEC/Rec2 [Shewanella cyperi]|uniref:DNA internalization-related competence protein ComEC/Rec2 n=1 Tax=Shewanella cyperi TaxID=2814292 RepID=A0A975ALD6_9GAMM|nr:DNA internalization-related competence protein ComEC/Rec2 [Shewanella cyperi]QSX31332.1 DNA internalization-related competence protein ComEC/Rec2 [Shewanella cyperi]